MNTTNDTMPAALRQLLVDAAAALENLSDFPYVIEENDDAREAVRLAGRLRDAAAGRDAANATFDGGDTITIPAGGNPVWVKAGGMTIQITPAGHGDCDHLTVDVWRADDPAMAEPWTVVFDGETARIT